MGCTCQAASLVSTPGTCWALDKSLSNEWMSVWGAQARTKVIVLESVPLNCFLNNCSTFLWGLRWKRQATWVSLVQETVWGLKRREIKMEWNLGLIQRTFSCFPVQSFWKIWRFGPDSSFYSAFFQRLLMEILISIMRTETGLFSEYSKYLAGAWHTGHDQ